MGCQLVQCIASAVQLGHVVAGDHVAGHDRVVAEVHHLEAERPRRAGIGRTDGYLHRRQHAPRSMPEGLFENRLVPWRGERREARAGEPLGIVPDQPCDRRRDRLDPTVDVHQHGDRRGVMHDCLESGHLAAGDLPTPTLAQIATRQHDDAELIVEEVVAAEQFEQVPSLGRVDDANLDRRADRLAGHGLHRRHGQAKVVGMDHVERAAADPVLAAPAAQLGRSVHVHHPHARVDGHHDVGDGIEKPRWVRPLRLDGHVHTSCDRHSKARPEGIERDDAPLRQSSTALS